MMIKHTLMVFALLAATAACKHEGSAVQKHYAADRQSCREYAESIVGGNYQGHFFPGEDMQVQLVRQFAHCMHKRGWAVNKPPAPPKS